MYKETMLMALGVWIIVLRVSGIPSSWQTGLFLLTGVGLIALGFFNRADTLSRGGKYPADAAFVENGKSGTGGVSAAHDKNNAL